MLDPANDLLPPPSSPTNSSISSSDLDTESTGSFFHDRSTTLGTLMGVSFPAITFRAPSQHHRDAHAASPSAAGASALSGSRKSKKPKKKSSASSSSAAVVVAERRRRWWWLCRDDGAKPASLGEFLEVERRFGDGAFYGTAAELEGVVVAAGGQPRNGRVLFADGRVLPPAEADEGTSTAGALCRFPVLLTGICSGCGG
ncbi:hypothetical protein FNV43_RR19897 [Rhamnella rubrinervis]|uniref:Uncharacterized protein n=1 Tax=Rhamnella rubrinervis TaxID=2594499 RepID=A0A8K0DZM9_9ROSA|nr:hypothetical protein FNV43_RR19897 [Rhamnella rubrinervis]